MDKKTALLIIDVQVAMFEGEDGAVYNAEKVLDNIYSILQKARSAGIPVVFVQHASEADKDYKKGTATWQIHPKITPLENETIVEKSKCDSFYKTDLNEVLKKKGITNLVIVGMQTEFCLDTTCRRAFSMGYQNILVDDAHSTFDSRILKAEQIIQHHNSVLGGGRFAELKHTDEIDFEAL